MNRLNAQEQTLLDVLGNTWDVRVFDECESTMDEAKKIKNSSSPLLVLAEHQSKGRGRRGNEWHSPEGGFYATVGFQFAEPVAACAGLSLVIGVAIAEALHLEAAGIKLKWPNDLVHQGSKKKLGGILIELLPSGAAHTALIGIGINLTPVGKSDCTSLLETNGQSYTPEMVAHILVPRLHAVFLQFMKMGFQGFRDTWMRNAVHTGRAVGVDMGGKVVRGDFIGVDSTGGLLLDVLGETTIIQAGHLVEW